MVLKMDTERHCCSKWWVVCVQNRRNVSVDIFCSHNTNNSSYLLSLTHFSLCSVSLRYRDLASLLNIFQTSWNIFIGEETARLKLRFGANSAHQFQLNKKILLADESEVY